MDVRSRVVWGSVVSVGMRVHVLGRLRVERAGTEIDVGPPRQQAVLVALLFRAGRVTTAAEIIDSVWGDRRPASAPALVRTYVSRLREALGPEAIERGPARSGYRLRLRTEQLDATHFRRQVERARRARVDGRPSVSADLLAEALGSWDGEALTDVPGPLAATERNRLGELRLLAATERFDVEIALGRHADVLPDLVAAVRCAPLQEDLVGLLMLAQHRCGRSAEALATFEVTRLRLRSELAVGPSRALSARRGQILGGAGR